MRKPAKQSDLVGWKASVIVVWLFAWELVFCFLPIIGDRPLEASSPTTQLSGSREEWGAFLESHNFFSKASPWNTSISPCVSYRAAPGIGALETGLTSWNPSWGNIAIYYARNSDPVEQVLFNAHTRTLVKQKVVRRWGNPPSVEQRILDLSSEVNPFPANQYSTTKAGLHRLPAFYNAWVQKGPVYIHVPRNAVPPPSSDGNMVVIQPNGTAMEMYSAIRFSSGPIVSSMFSFTPALGGMGEGYENGRSASMIEVYAGVIRDLDVISGQIRHALAVAAPPSLLKAGYVSPAAAFDSNSSKYAGTLPIGSHLALPSTLNLNSLGLLSNFGKKLASASQTYGMYIVDQGGAGLSLVVQSNPTSSVLSRESSAVQHDIDKIVHNLKLVTQPHEQGGTSGHRTDVCD